MLDSALGLGQSTATKATTAASESTLRTSAEWPLGKSADDLSIESLTKTLLKIQKQYRKQSKEQRKTMEEVKTIMIFGTAHQFDPNEVIFELEMLNHTPCYDSHEDQQKCFACKSTLKKPLKCEFCAMSYCQECRLRSRAFPCSIELENGEKITGKICKICDRKFMFLDQYQKRVSILRDCNPARPCRSCPWPTATSTFAT